MKDISHIDSKFRFVILASKRAKMLLRGAKQKIKSKHRNPIRIAQNEVKMGVIDYEIIQPKKEEAMEPEEQIFVGEDIIERGGEEREEIVEEAGLEEEEEVEEETEEEVEEELQHESEEEEAEGEEEKGDED